MNHPSWYHRVFLPGLQNCYLISNPHVKVGHFLWAGHIQYTMPLNAGLIEHMHTVFPSKKYMYMLCEPPPCCPCRAYGKFREISLALFRRYLRDWCLCGTGARISAAKFSIFKTRVVLSPLIFSVEIFVISLSLGTSLKINPSQIEIVIFNPNAPPTTHFF